MRTSIRQLAYDVADVITDMLSDTCDGRNEPGYPEAHPDDGRVTDKAFLGGEPKTDAFADVRAKTTDEALNAARMAEPVDQYAERHQRQYEAEQARFARQVAVERSIEFHKGRNPTVDVLLRDAERLHAFISMGVTDVAPNLGAVPTDALVAELSARVS